MVDDPRPSSVTYLLFILTSLWVIGLTVVIHFGGWLADQVLLIQGTPLPWYGSLMIAWVHALLLAVPVAPLAIFTRAPRFRAIYRAWALAIACGALLALARLFPWLWTQAAALAQVVLCLVAAGVLRWLTGSADEAPRPAGSGLWLGLALGALVTVPWALWGALGSATDVALAALAGLAFGSLAASLLDRALLPTLWTGRAGSGWNIALGGFAVGVALLILAAAFGFNGNQLVLMLVLPPLGFGVVALSRRAAFALLAAGAAAPLIFLDPSELLLLEPPTWVVRAVGVSFALGWLVSIGLSLARLGRSPRTEEDGRRGARALTGGIAATAWGGTALLYALAGQPGFYGDQLFVILRDQADVSPAAGIGGRDERLRSVYGTLTRHAMQSQANLRATLDGLEVDYTPYYLVNGLEVAGGPLLAAYLESQPEVDRVLISPHLRPLPDPPAVGRGDAAPPDGPVDNITMIGADRVWSELGVDGAGIVVGQSDSGVQGDHPALQAGYRGRATGDDYNWLDPWNASRSPVDIGGHGSHTLGTAVGRAGIGVAPGAEWFGCVNLARNIGNPALYLDCLQFMLAPYAQGADPFTAGDPSRAAHVLNNSWGCPDLEGCDPAALQPAVRALRAAGIFFVASAGNTGPGCASVDDPPALYDEVFSVGAVDLDGNVTAFSSRGPVTADGSGRLKPDLLAPGAEVRSAAPGSTYAVNDGTSMAGPHVAGVVALMWSAQPALIGDIERTEQILIETARPYDGEMVGCFGDDADGAAPAEPNVATGYGVVDAYAAVRAARAER